MKIISHYAGTVRDFRRARRARKQEEAKREGGERMSTKKSRSWDHDIQPINTKPGYNPNYNYVCSHPRCQQKAEYIASYRYVTGLKGRVSKATRLLCKEHADKFAIKYRLTLF